MKQFNNFVDQKLEDVRSEAKSAQKKLRQPTVEEGAYTNRDAKELKFILNRNLKSSQQGKRART